MSKLNKIQKILISLVVILIALLVKSESVQAVNFGNYYDLYFSHTYYCMQHQKHFYGGTYYAYSTTTIKSDNSSQANRALAYILYKGKSSGNGGYNRYSKYQIAVWKWYKNHTGINTLWPSGKSDYGLYNEAMKVKSIPYSSETASIVGTSSNITMTGSTGSIKLSKLGGTVSKVEVVWTDPSDGSKEYTQTISSDNSGKENWVGLYSDKNCTTSLKAKDISTGTFYVKNLNENYLVKSVTIYTKAEGSGYSVTITRWKRSPSVSSQQDLISATYTEGKDNESHKTFTAKYSYGKIKLVKKGAYKEDGTDKTESVSATFKIYCKTLNKWVAGDADGYKTYESDISKATSYKSETTVSKLCSTYEYEIVEISVDSEYYNNPIIMTSATSDLQKGLSVSTRDSYNSATGVIVYDEKTNTVTITNERTAGDLTIYKVDDTHKKVALQGAKMKVYVKDSGWLIKNSDGTYSYDGAIDKATEFETNSDGEINLTAIEFHTYYVYETEAPEGYDITKQDGYMNNNGTDPYSYSKDNKWVYLGSSDLGGKDNSVKYTVTNKKIVDKLEGYVWVDEPDTKANVADNVYGSASNDFLKSGITVNLYNGDNTIIAETTTDEKGHYEFTEKNASSYTGTDKNIYYWDLANAYVEFIYNNKTIYNEDGTVSKYGYVVVNPFEGTDATVNSKAQEYEMTTEKLNDKNLTGTTGTNLGRAVTYQATETLSADKLLDNTKTISEKIKNNNVSYDDLKETPLTGYYDNSTYTVSNVNLGLLEQNDPEFSVDENLAYIKVTMKGYTYTYKYGAEAATTSDYVPTVNEQNSAKTFTSKIYPSDIVYNMVTKDSEGLNVYVVYSIDVKNNETTYIDEKYVEQRLYLDSLTNEYDTARYELCTDKNNDDSTDFALWSVSEEGTASYDVNNSASVYKDGMGQLETKTSYIQFKIKESALEKILTGGLTYEDIESAPTVATAEAYHEYQRTDNVWKDNSDVVAFDGVKGTDYPTQNASNKKYYTHKSISKSEKSAALYLRLSLGTPRKISGTVFEDTTTEESKKNNTNLGNGVIDSSENNRANAVTVELLNANKQVSKLYKEDGTGKVVYNEDGTLPDAKVTTTTDGTFTFEGVVPGYYYIRFTYGDGTQALYDTNGNKVTDVTSKDYRSTIINTTDAGDTIKNAMEATSDQITTAQETLSSNPLDETSQKLLEWYKYLDDKAYSTAVDNTATRLTIQDYVYSEDGKVYDKDGNVVTDSIKVDAYTPMVGISIENDKNNYTDGDTHLNVYNKFNFGIIKEADTVVTLDKQITNVSFTTQTGTTLVSENPTSRTASYITALDDLGTGSKYAKMEIDPDLVYGSELKTTYTLTITNNSVYDYVEPDGSDKFGYYYKYGDKSEAELKKVTVKEVVDELDQKYNYDSIESEVVETVTRKDEDGKVTGTEEGKVTISKPTTSVETELDGTTTTTTTTNKLSMTGWSTIKSQDSTAITYTVTSLLSTQDDDTSYTNNARITKVSIDKLTTLKSNFTWSNDTTTLTITPTTGADRSNTYWIAGIMGLIVIAAGFVFIKKRILK